MTFRAPRRPFPTTLAALFDALLAAPTPTPDGYPARRCGKRCRPIGQTCRGGGRALPAFGPPAPRTPDRADKGCGPGDCGACGSGMTHNGQGPCICANGNILCNGECNEVPWAQCRENHQLGVFCVTEGAAQACCGPRSVCSGDARCCGAILDHSGCVDGVCWRRRGRR